MAIQERPGGLGNAGYISGKDVEREQARLAKQACRREAGLYAEHTLDMPGALADYCTEPARERGGNVWRAFAGAEVIQRGRGRTLRITGSPAVLDWFTVHADTILSLAGPGAEFSQAEVKAARVWLERYRAAGLDV